MLLFSIGAQAASSSESGIKTKVFNVLLSIQFQSAEKLLFIINYTARTEHLP